MRTSTLKVTYRHIIKFESILKTKNVFRYGDYGDKFYIILKGSVSVHVPKAQPKE